MKNVTAKNSKRNDDIDCTFRIDLLFYFSAKNHSETPSGAHALLYMKHSLFVCDLYV